MFLICVKVARLVFYLRRYMDSMSEPITQSFEPSYFDQLFSSYRYKDAYDYASLHFSYPDLLNQKDKITTAIKLLSRLGNDRGSDALLLRVWRRNRRDPELLIRILFYKLHTEGPVLAKRFCHKHHDLLVQATDSTIDLAVFEVMVWIRQKDFAAATKLLNELKQKNPDNQWLLRVELMLLREQQLHQEAAELSLQYYSLYPNDLMLVSVVKSMMSAQRHDEAIQLLIKYSPSFQNCDLWSDLIYLSAKAQDWDTCQAAISRFESTCITPDRTFREQLLVNKAKIALSSQDQTQALQYLAQCTFSYNKSLFCNLQRFQLQTGPAERLLNVPLVRQSHMTCAPATLTALASYWGDQVSQQDIIEKICYDGTPDTLERQWLRDHQYAFVEFELTEQLTYQLIDADLPFALVTTDGYNSHLQAVTGYNKALGLAYLMDPSSAHRVDYLLSVGLVREAHAGPRALLFVPDKQKHLLDTFDFPARHLFVHTDLFCVALEKRDLASAHQQLHQMQSLDPEHRLTVIAQRRLAIAQHDELEIARQNQRILQHYPNQVPWHISLFHSLKNQGLAQQALSYLTEQANRLNHLELWIALFSYLSNQHQHKTQSQQILKKLELRGCYNAEVYQQLADYYWQERDYEHACEYYFISCNLDQTQSSYFESYFKACRFLNRTEHAIALLEQNYFKYRQRSALPAISLCKALNWQSREQQGLDILYQALQFRPDDQELIHFTLEQLLLNGQQTELQRLLVEKTALLSESECWYWQGKLAKASGDYADAAQFHQKRFQLTPWKTSIAEAYFQVLLDAGNTEELRQQLTNLSQLQANQPVLQDYLADWHPDEQVSATAVEKLAAEFPHHDVYQRRRIHLLLKQNRLDEAENAALQLLRQMPHKEANQILLAQVWKQQKKITAAYEQVKTSLSQDIDFTDAIDLLFELSETPSQQKASLAFMYEQMQIQTLYGNSIWYYWFNGEQLLDDQQQQDFISRILLSHCHLWESRVVWSRILKNCDLHASLEQLQKAAEDFPLLPRVHLELADTYRLLGDKTQAISSYQQAVLINPKWSYAQRRLVEYLEEQAEFELAYNSLCHAIKYLPTDGLIHGFMADALLRTQQSQSAITHLTTAVKHNPEYPWAWRQLKKWTGEQGDKDFAQRLAEELVRERPTKVGPLLALTYVTEQPEHKIQSWLKVLELAPRRLDVHQSLLEFYVKQGQFNELFAHITQHFPEQQKPLEIIAVQAKAYEETGQTELAIDLLSAVLQEQNCELSYWEHLLALQGYAENKTAQQQTALLLLEKQPHQAASLAVSAEILLSADQPALVEKAEAALKYACQLAPSNQSVVLTYADYLLEQKHYQECGELLESIRQFHTNQWINQRQILLHLALEQQQLASELWVELVLSKEENFWLYNSLLDTNNLALQKSFIDLAEQHLADAASILGFVLMKFLLKNSQSQRATQLIKTLPHCDAWDGVYEAYLDYCSNQAILPPEQLSAPYLSRIEQNADLTGKYGYMLRSSLRYYDAAALYAKLPAPERLCYTSYHYALTLLDINRHQDAHQVLCEGMNTKPDNCFHNLQLWYIASSFKQDGTELDMLDYVDKTELTSSEVALSELLQFARRCKDEVPASDVVFQALKALRLQFRETGSDPKIKLPGNRLKSILLPAFAQRPFGERLALRLLLWLVF